MEHGRNMSPRAGVARARRWAHLIALAASLAWASTATAVRFTASGDFGTEGPTASAVLDQIVTSGSRLHLGLGDLTYGRAGGETAWCTFVKSRVGPDFPFQLIAGNHDSGLKHSSGTGYEPIIDSFVSDECLRQDHIPGVHGEYGRRWYIDVPQVDPVVRIIMASPSIEFRDPDSGIVTSSTYSADGEDYAWVRDRIDGARERAIPWVVAGTHYPCLTPGKYDCREAWGMGPDLMDLFVAKRVDLVLGGHEHLYARTHQLSYGADCSDRSVLTWLPKSSTDDADPRCIADETASMAKGAGTVFAIVGTGGRPLYDVDTSDNEGPYFAASSGANATPSFGNLVIDATATRLHARFASAAGTFADTFAIHAPTVASDSDGDGTPDATDLCRILAGPADRRGCPLVRRGTAGADSIAGSPLADRIHGLAGRDRLRGRAGGDAIAGGSGPDLIVGDSGADVLIGGPGADRMWGGPGNDRLLARDGVRDVVNCGTGRDRAVVDRFDVVRGCERVIVRR